MGRRSTNTTKSGKYMNPADQARKEARRKELKKNKKTRMAVRHAVLKSKDPQQLLHEMERVDLMEYNSDGPKLLHEKVLQEKRKKLRETFDRVMKMYEKENPEYWVELKRLLAEYDDKRQQLEQYAVAVKFASEVNPSEIPLPEITPAPGVFFEGMPYLLPPSDIPLPIEVPTPDGPVHSILKKPQPDDLPSLKKRQPPGPPPGRPPDLSDSEPEDAPEEGELPAEEEEEDDDNDDNEDNRTDDDDDESGDSEDEDLHGDDAGHEPYDPSKAFDLHTDKKESKSSRVRFQGVEEDESAEKDSRSRYKELAKKMMESDGLRGAEGTSSGPSSSAMGPVQPPGYNPGVPVAIRPPPMRPGQQMPMGAGPPRLLRPPPPPAGVPPPRMAGGPIRIPPPPPGFPPPRLMRPPGMPMIASGAVLSAPPSITRPPEVKVPEKPENSQNSEPAQKPATGATIEAKPQLRNMTAEVTRLVPTAVKLRAGKAETKPSHGAKKAKLSAGLPMVPGSTSKAPYAQPTKDDAYDQFMKEMAGLM